MQAILILADQLRYIFGAGAVATCADPLSPAAYNGKTSLMVCCPLTTRIKGYPFEVAIAGKPDSVVLADQVKSLDWRARRATRKGRVSAAELEEVRGKLRALVG